MSIFSRLYDSIFGKTKTQQDHENPTMTQRRSPMQVDMTENIKPNGELFRALLHNTAPGFKLAGALAYAPIMTPVSIMGLPTPIVSGSKRSQTMLAAWVERNRQDFERVHIASHNEGTTWVWPYYDADEGQAKLELIQDDNISDILRDAKTKRVFEIVESTQISIQYGVNQTKIVDRERRFTRERITDTINGSVTVMNNPLRMLPVCFSNEPDPGKMRGHPDLERIVPDLKAYHDVKLKWATNLAKMNPKFIQNVAPGNNVVGEWLANNGYASIADVDGAEIDFIINQTGLESSDFLTATGLGDEYLKYLTAGYWNIVQGSGLPELAWGLLSSGNHASAEENMEQLMSMCRRKQNQHTQNWQAVYQAILMFEARAAMMSTATVEVEWNRLDALSEKTKAEVFDKIAGAVQKLVVAAVPGETIWSKMKAFYPDALPDTYQEFFEQRQAAAKFKAFSSSSYDEIIDLNSQDDLDEDSNMNDTESVG